jgi:hypothetical protein
MGPLGTPLGVAPTKGQKMRSTRNYISLQSGAMSYDLELQ